MKAIVLHKTGGPGVLSTVEKVPVPEVKPGWVLIKVMAFGLNNSELTMRQYEGDASYIKLPRIIGIECAGEVADPSDSVLTKGQKVVALMGGMGRGFDGSYAEYTLVPAKNVFTIDSDLPWEELGAIPETYFTAYGSLTDSLQLMQGETLLVRGGTSALGLAAIQLGKAMGATVLASTRKKERTQMLTDQGADFALIDDGTLTGQVRQAVPEGIDKALEIVGPSTIPDTAKIMKHHGIICMVGHLGKDFTLPNFNPIKDMPIGVYLTGFYSNFPTQQAIDDIFSIIERNRLHARIGKVMRLDEVAQAHQLMENNQANGKIVILND